MKYVEFKNGLENGQEFSVYLFEGEDVFFRERGLTLLKNKFLSNPELNLVCFNGDVEVSDLIASLEGYPFMSNKRVTVVKEFYPKQEQLKSGLKNYLENPLNTSVLAILNEKPCEALKKFESVTVVECKKADASLIVKWIKGECIKANVSINGETCGLIGEFCLYDMTRIESETKKLIAYVGDGGEITSETVNEMVAKDTEYKIYEMTDYIGKKNFEKTLELLKDMFSKGETPQRIITSLYNYFRRLLHAAISGKTAGELASAYGVKEFAARKIKEQSAMFKKKALKSAVDFLTDADYKTKSGQMNADEGMWISLFRIFTEK